MHFQADPGCTTDKKLLRGKVSVGGERRSEAEFKGQFKCSSMLLVI